MDQLRYANIVLDVFCAMLSILPIVYLVSNHRCRLRLNRYFLGVCLSNILMIVGDLPDWILPTAGTAQQKLILMAGSCLYFAASAGVLFFFFRYLSEYLPLPQRAEKFCICFGLFLCVLQLIFTLITPFTGALFYVNADGYHRGPLFFLSQLCPMLCYLLFLILVLVYRKKLLVREVTFFLLYIIIPLSCGIAQMALRGIAIVNAGITLAALVILMSVQFEHEVTMKEQEKQLAEQHIDIMLSQVQPHFLYNSLGAIYHLCESDPESARKAIKHFSDFLRGNMDSLKKREPIPFGAELSHVNNYLYLEQQRFGDKLQVIYQIKTEDFLIPPLTLQPLVENAVQHGILNRRSGGTILIQTQEAGGYVVITVSDNGVGMEKARELPSLGDHTHTGIANVRSRLKEMVNGSLELESSDQGTTATIRIPWTEEVSL